MDDGQRRAPDWRDVSRAFDLVAQNLDSVDGALEGVEIPTRADALATLVALASYAANWIEGAEPDMTRTELAEMLRERAALIREVESIEPE